MPQRISSYGMIAVLLAIAPVAALAQSTKPAPKLHPATVVRPGGTPAGIAAPPADTRNRAGFRTGGVLGGFDAGVGVVVGSFGRPIGAVPRGRECANLSVAPASTAAVQPYASQPVVIQPGSGAVGQTEASANDSRGCRPRR